MAQLTEGATDSVEAVWFNFMTDKEVRKHSVLRVTNANLLDFLERPMPGGLYDPLLGPLEERTPCKTCGLLKLHCPGHCGHIDLVSPVYNPLLFNFLYTLLRSTCFFCYHFRASRTEVARCVFQLKLIGKGDIVGAKRLDSYSRDASAYPEFSEGSQELDSKAVNPKEWTSLQITEAMSVLNKFLKSNLKYNSCKNCDARNPEIKKPTFGWFHTIGMPGAQMRGNVIRGCKMADSFSGEAGLGIDDAGDASSSGNGVDIAEIDNPETGFIGAKDTAAKARKKKVQVPLEFIKQNNLFSGPLLPSEVKRFMKLLWENEFEICPLIGDIQQQGFVRKGGYSMFFLETILVPPTMFRAPTKGGDSVMEHPQTVLLSKVLQANISLGNAYTDNLHRSRVVVGLWMDLQQSINLLFDSKTAMSQRRDVSSGICQLLEKKEGVFRQKMMGKRVNFACRSVISPDPYLAVNEIGIPDYFALRLTYPERVTPWNIVKLREAIINGSEIHPGATHYVDKLSTQRLPPNRKSRISISRKLSSSRGAITQPGKDFQHEFEGKIVLRHLQDGDVVLVNRQPTLHKPSIMAHVVRVLNGEKTIRMHYANCSTYNADFDGDEINVHFPQDEISRAEAYNIVNANNQYIRPSNGEPIRALIQDHIISSVLLTKRDTFLSRDDFNQLLYSSGVSSLVQSSFSGKPGQRIFISSTEEGMLSILPAILKPKPLWTGKQVITAVLNHITRGHPPFTVENSGKIPHDFFKNRSNKNKPKNDGQEGKDAEENSKKEPDEEKIFIYRNYLVHGVIDKAQFADYGLVHTVQELYGSNTAGFLLSVFSRLFTVFLQMHGFTCGVDDLLLMKDKDIERKKQLEECEKKVTEVQFQLFGVNKDTEIAPIELQIERKIRGNGENSLTEELDAKVINVLNENLSQGVLADVLSEGLVKSMGKNCVSLMTTSGAKGNKVNFQQISAYLGQQVLEGKRVPRMVSGKTLPCFHPWDLEARAGGFISDGFLSGLRPQEYYFHCMAGREGLVDTAVKTSRSGYLQRCLIKNLECLKISYDHTVRDADGSIVQFNYGEDGIDVHQTSFIEKFEALALNQDLLSEKLSSKIGEPDDYGETLPDGLRDKASQFVDKNLHQKIKPEDFLKLLKLKFLSSLAQPGEPVGVLAAQSVGEPSTQMTLNTFHLAGRGEMNVTLGIPRLQEILMTASTDISNPVMTCPLRHGKTEKEYDAFANKMKKIKVADILEGVISIGSVADVDDITIYKLKMWVKRPENDMTIDDYEDILTVDFLRELEDDIQSHIEFLSRINGIKAYRPDSISNALNERDEDASERRSHESDSDDEDKAEDLGIDAQKQKRQTADEVDYEDGSEEEQNVEASETEIDISGGPREENATIENNVIGSKPKRKKRTFQKKKFDRSKLTRFDKKELCYEVHFRFTNDEPRILWDQIVKKAANKVYIQSFGKIEQCQVIDCSNKQVLYYGEDPKKRSSPSDKKKIPAVRTVGVDLDAFWKMEDELDLRYLYTNNIQEMLDKYGVEAARESIITEINYVFQSYSINVNKRHLTVIADFMTHSGRYRPMSRFGGIAESISPFSKMSFETASKFIVEAAKYRLVDNLETPSSRICLGLPVKMGTGSFDLINKVDI